MMMTRSVGLIAIVMAAMILAVRGGGGDDNNDDQIIDPPLPCRFAPKFTAQQLLTSQSARDSFMDAVYYWEGNFHQHGIGLNTVSGLTYDGSPLNYTSGETINTPHLFSAASKESIHIGLLALALNGDRRALTFVLNTDQTPTRLKARAWAITLLQRKITSYQQFNATYPGFGCFLPWFTVSDTGLAPTWDWQHTVPSLDNGELIWALFAVGNVLEEQGFSELATAYKAWTQCMTLNARLVFYNATQQGFRTVTTIVDTYAVPTQQNYNDGGHTAGVLDDPYEGELFTVWMDTYGVKLGVMTSQEMDAMWVMKRAKLSVATLNVGSEPNQQISTERGWWFSAHEKWKYLMIPYLSVPINYRVFMNGERARSWYGWLTQTPGLFASVNGPVPASAGDQFPYYSAVGVQSLAYQQITVSDVVTPYGTLALFLAKPEVALVWYATMLNTTKMQNVYGSTESFNTTTYDSSAMAGTTTTKTNDICPLTTWDSKITTLLAMSGGLATINQEFMNRDQVFQRFWMRIDTEWSAVFANALVGEDLGFKIPDQDVTPLQFGPDFTTCN